MSTIVYVKTNDDEDDRIDHEWMEKSKATISLTHDAHATVSYWHIEWGDVIKRGIIHV